MNKKLISAVNLVQLLLQCKMEKQAKYFAKKYLVNSGYEKLDSSIESLFDNEFDSAQYMFNEFLIEPEYSEPPDDNFNHQSDLISESDTYCPACMEDPCMCSDPF